MYSDLHPLEFNNDYSKPILIPINEKSSKLSDILKLFNNKDYSDGTSFLKMPKISILNSEPFGNKFDFTVGNKPATLTSDYRPLNNVNKPFMDSFDKTKELLFPMKKSCKYMNKFKSSNNITENIQYETIIVFFISFIILFLLSKNISFLTYEDKKLNRNRPNLFRIMLLSFVISVFFLMQSNVSLLESF